MSKLGKNVVEIGFSVDIDIKGYEKKIQNS